MGLGFPSLSTTVTQVPGASLGWKVKASYEGRNLGFVTCSAMSTRLVPPCIWVWLLSASDLLPFSNKDAGAAIGLCFLGNM